MRVSVCLGAILILEYLDLHSDNSASWQEQNRQEYILIPEYPKRTRPKHSNRNRVITFDTYLETILLGYQETRRSRRQDGVKLTILVRTLNSGKIIQIQLMLQQRPNDIYCKTSKDYT